MIITIIECLQNFAWKGSSINACPVYSRNINPYQFSNRESYLSFSAFNNCSHSFYTFFYIFSCNFTKFFMICGHDIRWRWSTFRFWYINVICPALIIVLIIACLDHLTQYSLLILPLHSHYFVQSHCLVYLPRSLCLDHLTQYSLLILPLHSHYFVQSHCLVYLP